MYGKSMTKKPKQSKKVTGESEKKNLPTYVGDLPVKIIQDIIDNLAISGDWEVIAGRTGITERQVRILRSKHTDPTEIARIVFDQWLCRIPKPKDLANLLMYVNRVGDIRKLEPYLSPKDWTDVERRMRRLTNSSPPRSEPSISEPEVIRVPPHNRVTASEEESSSSSHTKTTSQPPRSRTSAATSSVAISEVSGSRTTRHSHLTARSVRSADNDDLLSQGGIVPVQHSSTRPDVTRMERDFRDRAMTPSSRFSSPTPTPNSTEILDFFLNFLPKFGLEMEYGLTPMEGKTHLSTFTCYNQDWVVKDFSGKDSYKLRNEIFGLMRFRHPHIISLAGIYYHTDMEQEHLVYPRMEADLEVFLRSDGRAQDVLTRVDILRQICTALCYIHQQDYVHHDLKMSNILLDSNLHAYLNDFELTQAIGQPVDPNMVEGSKPFVPLLGNYSTLERDLYAFGLVMAYVFLCRSVTEEHHHKIASDIVVELFDSAVASDPAHQELHPKLKELCLFCVGQEKKTKMNTIEILERLTSMLESARGARDQGSERFWQICPQDKVFSSEERYPENFWQIHTQDKVLSSNSEDYWHGIVQDKGDGDCPDSENDDFPIDG